MNKRGFKLFAVLVLALGTFGFAHAAGSMMPAGTNMGAPISNPAPVTTVPAVTAPATSAPNIFWRNTATGQNSVWMMSGGMMGGMMNFSTNNMMAPVADPNWIMVGMGDFNGDGQPDILWQHQATGSLSAWMMNGTNLVSLATVNPGMVSDTNWKIVGVADFNGDGHPDILWQHQTTGTLSAWMMNGTNLVSLATVNPGMVSDTNWKIVGVADFNGDGHPDILWQHRTTGTLSAWMMNGTNLAALATVNPGAVSDTNWKIVGVGDFNGDGQPDILWHHQATGSLSSWLMNGTNLATLGTVTPGVVSDLNWKVMGVWK